MNKIALMKLKACMFILATDTSLGGYKDIVKKYIPNGNNSVDVEPTGTWYGHHPDYDGWMRCPAFEDTQFLYLRLFTEVLLDPTTEPRTRHELSKTCYFHKVNPSTSRIGFDFDAACNLLDIKSEPNLLEFLLENKQAFLFFGFITWVKDNGLHFNQINVWDLSSRIKHKLVIPATAHGVSRSFATRIYDILENK